MNLFNEPHIYYHENRSPLLTYPFHAFVQKTQYDVISPKHDTVLAGYPNWYMFKAPVDKEI